jgi:hypothetical protein
MTFLFRRVLFDVEDLSDSVRFKRAFALLDAGDVALVGDLVLVHEEGRDEDGANGADGVAKGSRVRIGLAHTTQEPSSPEANGAGKGKGRFGRVVRALTGVKFIDLAVAVVVVSVAGVEGARVDVVARVVAVEAPAGRREEAVEVSVAGCARGTSGGGRRGAGFGRGTGRTAPEENCKDGKREAGTEGLHRKHHFT